MYCYLIVTVFMLRLADECFIVRPDNSVCHQCIGARGNMCLLHISQYGVILALQVSTHHLSDGSHGSVPVTFSRNDEQQCIVCEVARF